MIVDRTSLAAVDADLARVARGMADATPLLGHLARAMVLFRDPTFDVARLRPPVPEGDRPLVTALARAIARSPAAMQRAQGLLRQGTELRRAIQVAARGREALGDPPAADDVAALALPELMGLALPFADLAGALRAEPALAEALA